jgi:plasmid stability protein
MKNITVSLDDETYRRARIRAAEQDTSVSAMVKKFLVENVAGESETERLKKEEARIRDAIRSFRAGDRLSRGEAHARGQ